MLYLFKSSGFTGRVEMDVGDMGYLNFVDMFTFFWYKLQ